MAKKKKSKLIKAKQPPPIKGLKPMRLDKEEVKSHKINPIKQQKKSSYWGSYTSGGLRMTFD